MSDSSKPVCKYGEKCFRTNAEHLRNYKHPNKETSSESPPAYNLRSPRDTKRSISPKSANKDSKKADENSAKKPKRTNLKDYFSKVPSTSKSPLPSTKAAALKSPVPSAKAVEPKSQNKNNTDDYNPIYDIPDIIQPDSSLPTAREYFSSLQRRDKNIAKREYADMLTKPDKFIRQHFLVKMPEDFYHFWVWVTEKSEEKCNPEEFLKSLHLDLVGPFDVLAGKFNDVPQFEPSQYLRHYRYFYDPPEFQVSTINFHLIYKQC